MEQALFELAGTDGTLYVYEDRLELVRKTGWNWTRGTFAAGGKGVRTIPLKTIRSVEIREMTAFVLGMLYIDTGEGAARTSPVGALGGGTNNQILFGGVHNKKDYCEKCNETLRQIKAFIDERTLKQQEGGAALSAADELKKFKELLDSGIITRDEFEAKKKQLLGI